MTSTLNNSDIDIDALFSQARDSQPELVDENFTKVVMNSLPAKPRRLKSRGFSFDLVGLLIGVVATYLLIDPAQAGAFVMQIIPESLVLSPLNLLAAGLGVVSLSLSAWWVVEKKPGLL